MDISNIDLGKNGIVSFKDATARQLINNILSSIPNKTSQLINDGNGTSNFATLQYVINSIEAIPTPDVSGQIATHNQNNEAHQDIRLLLNTKQSIIDDLNTIRNGANAGATAVQPSAIGDLASLNNINYESNYITNKPNLSNFITNTVNSLTNYYLKSETYTQAETNALVSAITDLIPLQATSNNQLADKEFVNSSILTATSAIDKTKLDGIESGAQVNTVASVNTKTGSVVLDADDISDTNTTNKFVTASDKETWNGKQDTTDNSLTTISNSIVGAINEINSIAKGRAYTKEYDSYSDMITALNAMDNTTLKAGDNIYIVKEGPDLWIGKVEAASSQYTYTSDASFISAITESLSTTVQVGYYRLCKLETQKVDLTSYVRNTDYATSANAGVVKSGSGFLINSSGIPSASNWNYSTYLGNSTAVFIGKGTLENVFAGKGFNTLTGSSAPTTSTTGVVGQIYLDTSNGKTYQCVAKTTEDDVTTYTWVQLVRVTDYATQDTAGAVKINAGYGIKIFSNGTLAMQAANNNGITAKSSDYYPIVPATLDFAVKVGVTTNVNNLTDTEKTNAQTWLGLNTLYGSSAPTTSTVGRVGQIYLDTTNNKTYQCVTTTTEDNVTTYTWAQLIRATDYATTSSVGVVKVGSAYGTTMAEGDKIAIWSAQTTDIDAKTSSRKPVVPNNLDYAVKVGVTTNVNTLTDTEKTNACAWLGTGKVLTKTQAEYDALVDADTVDTNTYYFIKEE